MRKAVAGFWWSPASEGVSALAVTAAFFALGSVWGYFASASALDGGEVISAYLTRFLSEAQMDGLLYPDLLQFLWLSLRWPFAAFVLGFSSLGLLGIPILSVTRGFLFSFSVGVFARILGRRGLAAAFLLLGISGLITIPIFLLVATQSFLTAKRLAVRGGQNPYDRPYILRCIFSALFLLVGLILEWYFVPTLLANWAGALL